MSTLRAQREEMLEALWQTATGLPSREGVAIKMGTNRVEIVGGDHMMTVAPDGKTGSYTMTKDGWACLWMGKDNDPQAALKLAIECCANNAMRMRVDANAKKLREEQQIWLAKVGWTNPTVNVWTNRDIMEQEGTIVVPVSLSGTMCKGSLLHRIEGASAILKLAMSTKSISSTVPYAFRPHGDHLLAFLVTRDTSGKRLDPKQIKANLEEMAHAWQNVPLKRKGRISIPMIGCGGDEHTDWKRISSEISWLVHASWAFENVHLVTRGNTLFRYGCYEEMPI